jgi:hypothetical protein
VSSLKLSFPVSVRLSPLDIGLGIEDICCMQIGTLEVNGNVFLAPMAGITDTAFGTVSLCPATNMRE